MAKIDKNTIEQVYRELEAIFGNRFSNNLSVRDAHSHNVTTLRHQIPDGVVYALTKEDVVKAVRICARYKMPIIGFGVGSSLEGQLNAPEGGISIDFSKMDEVISFSPEDMTITVQPGITREKLNS